MIPKPYPSVPVQRRRRDKLKRLDSSLFVVGTLVRGATGCDVAVTVDIFFFSAVSVLLLLEIRELDGIKSQVLLLEAQ